MEEQGMIHKHCKLNKLSSSVNAIAAISKILQEVIDIFRTWRGGGLNPIPEVLGCSPNISSAIPGCI